MDPYGVINGSLIHNGSTRVVGVHIHSNRPVDGNNFGGVWPLVFSLADPENGCCPRQPNVPNTRGNWRQWNWSDPPMKNLAPLSMNFFLFRLERVEREGFRFLSNEQEKRKKSKIENFQLEICLLKLCEELNRGK